MVKIKGIGNQIWDDLDIRGMGSMADWGNNKDMVGEVGDMSISHTQCGFLCI